MFEVILITRETTAIIKDESRKKSRLRQHSIVYIEPHWVDLEPHSLPLLPRENNHDRDGRSLSYSQLSNGPFEYIPQHGYSPVQSFTDRRLT